MYLIKIFLLFSFVSCSSDKRCVDVQTGKFELNDARIGYHTIIERNEQFQIETNVENGNQTRCSVRWLNDCTYVLKYLNTESEVLKSYIGTELTIEITKIEGKKVYFSAIMEGQNKKTPFFMTKVE